MSGDEAIDEAREMVARNFTCELCVVSELLSAIAAEREKVRVLRDALKYLPIHDETDPFSTSETICKTLKATEDKR